MVNLFQRLQHLTYAIIIVSVAQVASADTRVKAVQERLVQLGYNPGIVDGVWGGNTQAALNQFLNSKGQTFDGRLDNNEFEILGIASVRNQGLKFQYHIHDSLPRAWVSEFETIMFILQGILPIDKNIDRFVNNPTMNVYAYNDTQKDPFGRGMAGSCICGDERTRWMVLEISEQELKNRNLHRYSVIAHEYFHIYQIGLSKGRMEPKWLVEGGAKVLEEMFVQQYYGRNLLRNDLGRRELWNDKVFTDPYLYESRVTSPHQAETGAVDGNYAGSAFMVLALVNELQRNNISEEEAFRLVFRDFWVANASEPSWKAAFEKTFGMDVHDFYDQMGSYSRRDARKILPSRSLTLQDIFM